MASERRNGTATPRWTRNARAGPPENQSADAAKKHHIGKRDHPVRAAPRANSVDEGQTPSMVPTVPRISSTMAAPDRWHGAPSRQRAGNGRARPRICGAATGGDREPRRDADESQGDGVIRNRPPIPNMPDHEKPPAAPIAKDEKMLNRQVGDREEVTSCTRSAFLIEPSGRPDRVRLGAKGRTKWIRLHDKRAAKADSTPLQTELLRRDKENPLRSGLF